jgi:hypothetical protein
MSDECVAGSYSHRTVSEYEARLQKYYRVINQMILLLSPEIYAAHSKHSQKTTQTTRCFSYASACLHLALTVVRNLQVLSHTNPGDLPDSLVVMTNLGRKASRAELVVGTSKLQIRFRYKAGDVITFDSYLMAHGVTSFLPDASKRAASVLCSHCDTVYHRPSYQVAPPATLGKPFQRYSDIGAQSGCIFL